MNRPADPLEYLCQYGPLRIEVAPDGATEVELVLSEVPHPWLRSLGLARKCKAPDLHSSIAKLADQVETARLDIQARMRWEALSTIRRLADDPDTPADFVAWAAAAPDVDLARAPETVNA